MADDRKGSPRAVLLMGYGSPAGPKDVPGFLREVLRGREPSAAHVQEYCRRYDLIGWSPQMRITEHLRAELEQRLHAQGDPRRVFLATKHWAPHIAEVIPQLAAQGIREVLAIPLSPYASPWILRPYLEAIEQGRSHAKAPIEVEVRSGWHRSPELRAYWAKAIRGTMAKAGSAPFVFLSAHSLPQRHQREGDPYPAILHETAELVAAETGLARWEFTYQSAGNTTEAWLGPDITERMAAREKEGYREQVVASIGFLFDHLETLYDLDVVVQKAAREHRIGYHRVPMPNDDAHVVEALAAIVAAPTWPSAAG